MTSFRISRLYKRITRGFTLIELLVVIAIMLVITTLILARHSQFNGTVLLRNLTYSMALSIRQAQVYGISGKSVSGTIGTQFGMYFTKSSPQQYILFVDSDGDSTYDEGEEIEVLRMGTGYYILNMCANTGVSVKCSGANDFTHLTILFKRPNPDARFVTDIPGEAYTDVTITVISATEVTRTIKVTTTGQIGVQQE